MSAFIPTGTYAEVRVTWYHPYEDPPHGQPRIIWAACIPWPYHGDYHALA